MRVCRLEHREGDLVALRDLGECLAATHIMVYERYPLVDRQVGIALGHQRACRARYADDDAPARGGDATDELRVQLKHCRHRRIGEASKNIKTGRIRNRDLVENQW